MHRQDVISLMKDRAPSAEFYVQSPFRYRPFIYITIMFAFDLLVCAFIVIWGWRRLGFSTGSYMAFIVVFLVGLWRLGFRVHEQIYIQFVAGRIEKLERGSPIDKVLLATTEMVLGGLSGIGLLTAFCLVALGERIFSH
jgi:hypothetical protein